MTSYRDEGNHTTVSIDPDRGALTWETVRDGERTEGGRFGPLRRDFAPGASHQLLLRPGPDATRVTLDGVSMGTLPPALQPQGPLGVWTSHTGVTVTGVTLTDLA